MGKRLYVGNLAYSVTEADLREVFGESGEISEVKMMLDRETGRPRGFAFVEMTSDGAAAKAIENLNGRDLQGRTLTVNEAQQRSGGGGAGGGGGRGWSSGGGGGGGQRRW
jgi:RNA recognition motif-containing protein